MLNHHYQHWYTRFFHLSQWEWYAVLAVVLLAAGLSVIRPFALKSLVIVAWRKIKSKFRFRRRGPGIDFYGQWLPDSARLRHTDLSGSTGTGKTHALKKLILETIRRGCGAVIIDPKGARELYEEVLYYCRKIGRGGDVHLLSATHEDESVSWNPCRLGNAAELQSKWFNSGVYTEPHYAKACELGLLQAFNGLLIDRDREGFTISDLVDRLKTLAQQTKTENMQGLFMDLQNFSEGEWGELICDDRGVAAQKQRREISLLEITRKNEILFVDLPTEAKAVQSARMGKLILHELMLISGLRKIYPKIKTDRPFSIFVDEFDAFATESFATFLNKARSSDFMIHIAHQTLSDLEKVSRAFMGQILGNINVRFIFRQDNPDDAETWARFIGTRTSVKKTFQTDMGLQTGRSSNRETQEFKIHPDIIKTLKIGECVFSMKTEGELKLLKIPFEKNPVIEPSFPTDRGPSPITTYRSCDMDHDTDEMAGIAKHRKKKESVAIT